MSKSAAAVVLLLACLRVTAAQEACADQKDCEACVKFDGLFSGGCSWCKEAGTCFDEQTNGDSFCGTRCKGNDCFYKTCKLNNQTVLYVIVPIVCVVLIALIALLIWCCWCRPNAKLKAWRYKEDKKHADRREVREANQVERRSDRQAQTDMIRSKYGLVDNTRSVA